MDDGLFTRAGEPRKNSKISPRSRIRKPPCHRACCHRGTRNRSVPQVITSLHVRVLQRRQRPNAPRPPGAKNRRRSRIIHKFWHFFSPRVSPQLGSRLSASDTSPGQGPPGASEDSPPLGDLEAECVLPRRSPRRPPGVLTDTAACSRGSGTFCSPLCLRRVLRCTYLESYVQLHLVNTSCQQTTPGPEPGVHWHLVPGHPEQLAPSRTRTAIILGTSSVGYTVPAVRLPTGRLVLTSQ